MDDCPDYLIIRDALLQDSSRDQRIHDWIYSQYDFALSEIEPSRADSPLLGFSECAIPCPKAPTSSNEHSRSSQETEVCPSYDPLFFPVASQENLSPADQEFEERERERALKSLIEDMNLWHEFPRAGGQQQEQDCIREKSLPPLPPPAPPCSPYSSPARSRRPSHTLTHHSANSRSHSNRLPSISSTLSNAQPVLRVEDVLYVDQDMDVPTPTGTPLPTPLPTRAPAPAPLNLNLFTTLESLRNAPPASPTVTSTTEASTPALSPSSPLSLSHPQPYALPHSRSTSFGESLYTVPSPTTTTFSSGPGSPNSSAYLTTPESAWHIPAVITTNGDADTNADVIPPTSESKFHNFPSRARDQSTLCVPPLESRWSAGSSLPDDDEPASPSADSGNYPKTPSKRRRLFSLMSLLSPSGKEAKDSRSARRKSCTNPSSPVASSIFLADSNVNASCASNDFTLVNIDPNYNPYYDNSTSDSSSLSKKGSLTTLGYGGRSIVKPKKRKLVVSGIREHDRRAYEAVKLWCESFGQIRSMGRKANGEIHVDFRKSSVADTVCRVRAGVVIKDAGRVNLSWYTGKKSSKR